MKKKQSLAEKLLDTSKNFLRLHQFAKAYPGALEALNSDLNEGGCTLFDRHNEPLGKITALIEDPSASFFLSEDERPDKSGEKTLVIESPGSDNDELWIPELREWVLVYDLSGPPEEREKGNS